MTARNSTPLQRPCGPAAELRQREGAIHPVGRRSQALEGEAFAPPPYPNRNRGFTRAFFKYS